MRKESIKRLLIIIAFAVLVVAGFKWFMNLANDDLGDYDGGRGKYEDAIENG
ncbi:MAG: hypothetical protein IKH78_07150 [Ruminococcus sp.]|nr:hypothetical protein [Ruminococcus sp.]